MVGWMDDDDDTDTFEYRILALAAAYTLFAKSHAISYVIFILARLRRTTRKLGAIILRVSVSLADTKFVRLMAQWQ